MITNIEDFVDVVGLTSTRDRKGLVPFGYQTLMKYVKAGEFPKPRKMGKKFYWLRADVEAWFDELADGFEDGAFACDYRAS